MRKDFKSKAILKNKEDVGDIRWSTCQNPPEHQANKKKNEMRSDAKSDKQKKEHHEQQDMALNGVHEA